MLDRFETDYPYNICMTSAEELNHTDDTDGIRMSASGLGCCQELSGMNQEWSGMTSLKNCWVIAGLLTKKTVIG